tara:strand:- start:13 stop:807 length:795 start_codon:yes stop_codon:yes gene_type:complete
VNEEIFQKISSKGWDILDKDNALLVGKSCFKEEFENLDNALSDFEIPVTDFIRSGGGLAEPTKRLTNIVNSFHWKKNNVTSETKVTFSDKSLDPIQTNAISHEIDHVGFDSKKNKKFALEIEWSNKDEFFDRDFSAMKGLYNIGAIELGIVILKGSNFNDKAKKEIENYFIDKVESQDDFISVQEHINSVGGTFTFPTNTQLDAINTKNKKLKDYPLSVSEVFWSNKYGSTTTTWKQLLKRLDRGSAERLPMIFLGIPGEVISS